MGAMGNRQKWRSVFVLQGHGLSTTMGIILTSQYITILWVQCGQVEYQANQLNLSVKRGEIHETR